MKQISKWSIVGIGCGLVFSLLSSIRYFVVYPDMDKAVVYTVIGGCICGVSWIYNVLVGHGNRLNAIEEYLAELE